MSMIRQQEIPWITRVEKAFLSKAFTDDDKKMAALWITDPFSEYRDVVQCRYGDHVMGPSDIYLRLDGIYFTKGVEDNDVLLSLACFMSMYSRIMRLCPDSQDVAKAHSDVVEMYGRCRKCMPK
jgi:hypothetical protein